MSYLFITFLAVVQGIAEFLPISSSGHLEVLSQALTRLGATLPSESLTISLTLHAGTLFSILIYYRKTLLEIILKLRIKLVALLALGTIPAATFGLIIDKKFGDILTNLWVIAPCFLITAFLLFLSQNRSTRNEAAVEVDSDSSLPLENLTIAQALIVGFTQAIAVLPGLSRSGSTIAAGLLSGLNQKDAASFSFLLAIPVIGGACLIHAVKLLKQGVENFPVAELTFGFILSFVVGLFALNWIIGWLQKGRLSWFSYWLIAASAGTFALAIF